LGLRDAARGRRQSIVLDPDGVFSGASPAPMSSETRENRPIVVAMALHPSRANFPLKSKAKNFLTAHRSALDRQKKEFVL
jgi:hypothetical protein